MSRTDPGRHAEGGRALRSAGRAARAFGQRAHRRGSRAVAGAAAWGRTADQRLRARPRGRARFQPRARVDRCGLRRPTTTYFTSSAAQAFYDQISSRVCAPAWRVRSVGAHQRAAAERSWRRSQLLSSRVAALTRPEDLRTRRSASSRLATSARCRFRSSRAASSTSATRWRRRASP
mgnify:CR=1 FL=1